MARQKIAKKVETAARAKADDTPLRGQKTKDALIDAALRLINEKGVEGASVLGITQALGISNGTFYYHFPNMDSLLEDVGHSLIAKLSVYTRSAQRPDPAALVAIGPLIMIRYAERHPELKAVLLRVLEDPEGRHKDLHNRLRDRVETGIRLGRFAVQDIDLASHFCRAILAAAVSRQSASVDSRSDAVQTSTHTLTLLGLPFWEAYHIAEQEQNIMLTEIGNWPDPVEIAAAAASTA